LKCRFRAGWSRSKSKGDVPNWTKNMSRFASAMIWSTDLMAIGKAGFSSRLARPSLRRGALLAHAQRQPLAIPFTSGGLVVV
jgi:hypothetical protein